MPEIIIIAGPNGAGKTSFANEYLPFEREGLEFVNADEIAREIEPLNLKKSLRDIRSGRLMLKRITSLVEARREFMLETTLATLTYAKKIPVWQKFGYTVTLVYLQLPSVEHSIARVQKRVNNGGHNIPENVIRRRFDKSLEYLNNLYKPIVDDWYIWESLEGDFQCIEAWSDDL